MPQQSKEAKNRRTNKKRDIQKDVSFLLVREAGLELSWSGLASC